MPRLFKSIGIVIMACLLGGCLSSSYDIAAQVQPVYPLQEGTYTGKDGRESEIVYEGNVYLIRESRGDIELQIFEVPESPLHIMQLKNTEEDGTISYLYMFMKVAEDGQAFSTAEVKSEDWKNLAPHIRKLLKDNTIPNGERDTLYVLREVLRTKAPLSWGQEMQLQ